MSLIRYNVATTLDGFIASLDGSTSWIMEDATIDFDALYAQFSLFIMGRKTYEVMLKYGNPLAKYTKESVVVFSTTMKADEHPGVTIVSCDVVGYVRERKKSAEKDIWVMGGGSLVGLLMEQRLVDVVEAAVMPVVIGEGIKMVGGLGSMKRLKLESVEKLESGILMTKYLVLNGNGV
ncbi:hypothetical protein OQA88_13331 [Cercophora sp. LCS_1]